MKTSIIIYKDSEFSGFDGKMYRVLETKRVELPSGNAGVVTKFMTLLIELKLIELIGDIDYESEERSPDENLLFRVATMVDDEDVLFSVGTLTWLDDIVCLMNSKTMTTPLVSNTETELIYTVLKAIIDLLDRDDINNARNTSTVDAIISQITSIGYDAYNEFVMGLHGLMLDHE